MGFFVAASSGLLGTFIILRKMALLGDAISHSLLPGIALAFLLTNSRATLPMVIGALVAGVLTVLCIEWIHKWTHIKSDAAIGIVFSTFFATGVVIISLFADHIDLDLDCVLYGEIAFIPMEEPLILMGHNFAPIPVIRMGIVFISLLILIWAFYKELLVTTFDSALARSLGISPSYFQYGLTLVLSLVIVSAFESVGAILVIAMLLFPGATAMLFSHNLKHILGVVIVLAVLYAILSLPLAYKVNCSISGSMTVVASILFILGCIYHLLRKKILKSAQSSLIATPKS